MTIQTRDISVTTGRLLIRCIRPDLTDDRVRDEHEMMALGLRLGRAVDETVVLLDPAALWPLSTIRLALRRTRANGVIVPDLRHVEGIDDAIRLEAELITTEGEQVLIQARSRVEVTGLGINTGRSA
ncbi:hypothetical protein [Nocardia sp. BMG51109]|uniref:hypothetical protein n=1 Tax=Nocardia sp. BMG51109 TaxID=1056816 RepID=UPI0004648717|nr:hypothetical protein [Nocardia sp. BMG51109]